MTDISDELVEKALHAWKENYDDEALGDAAWGADRFAFRKVLEVVVPEIERPLRNEIERRTALLRRLQDERSIDKRRTEAQLANRDSQHRQLAERDQEIKRLKAGLWKCSVISGCDPTDGPPTSPDIVEVATSDVIELRDSYEEALIDIERLGRLVNVAASGMDEDVLKDLRRAFDGILFTDAEREALLHWTNPANLVRESDGVLESARAKLERGA